MEEVIPGSSVFRQLQEIRNQFSTPEDINEGKDLALSKRILRLFNGYNKVLYGTRIVKRMGLDKLMEECGHFNRWISALRSLKKI
jgi:hypothetical protein